MNNNLTKEQRRTVWFLAIFITAFMFLSVILLSLAINLWIFPYLGLRYY